MADEDTTGVDPYPPLEEPPGTPAPQEPGVPYYSLPEPPPEEPTPQENGIPSWGGGSPYNDDGSLKSGWLIDPNTGEPYQVQNVASQFPGVYQYPTDPWGGSPYDDNGTLKPGWQLDENNNPVYVGIPKAQNDPVGNIISSAANAVSTSITDLVGRGIRNLISGATGGIPAFSNPTGVPNNINTVLNTAAAAGAAYTGAVNAGNTTVDSQDPARTGGTGGGAGGGAGGGDYDNSNTRALVEQAQYSATANNQLDTNPRNFDWRLRISLAPGATYLYRDPNLINNPNLSILAPLANTDGVIFPYTPVISTRYHANYSPTDITHSNYKSYFYQSSAVDPINIRGMFTAQNFQEAQYLLAVIHFFKSASKMFYGNRDTNAGSPPPVLFMSGLGEYQFNDHPVVLSNFEYTLPSDVDYIRTTVPVDNLNQQQIRNRANPAFSSQFAGAIRLASALNIFGQPLQSGAVFTPYQSTKSTYPTYVPTKIEMSISLLPIQSRQQVSNQFNMQDYASGKLITQGFW